MLSLAKARKDFSVRKVGEVSHREDYYLRGGSATGRRHGEVSAPSIRQNSRQSSYPKRLRLTAQR